MTPRLPPIPDRLARIESELNARLDRVADTLPEVKPARNQPAFTDYLARAQERAQRDPDFKQQFDTALAKYRAAGGG